MRQFLIISIIGLTLQSCCFSTKNKSLGGNFKLSEYSECETEIMYCFDDCCNSGYTIIPQTVIEYNYDDNWIIAKNDSICHSPSKHTAYWIFKKGTCSDDKMYDFIQANLIGPLDSITFYKTLQEKRITLQLIKY